MRKIKGLLNSLAGDELRRRAGVKPRPVGAVACESLEGRQLLNASWGPMRQGGNSNPADFQSHGGPGAAGHHQFAPPTLSAAARADRTTLEADRKALMTEVSADTSLTALRAAVKADAAAIRTALGPDATASSRPPVTSHVWDGKTVNHGGPFKMAGHPMGAGMHRRPGGFGPGAGDLQGDTLPAALVTKLESKGVTAAQITTFEADLKALHTATDAVDPTLQAKIKAEETALKNDTPAHPTHAPMIKAPAPTA